MTLLRALAAVIRVDLAAGRGLCAAFVAFSLFATVSLAVLAFSLKLLVDAVVDSSASVVAGGVLAAVSLSASVASLPIGVALFITLQERIGAVLDRRLMTLVAAIPTLDVHDREEYAGKVQLLSDDDRHPITASLSLLIGVVSSTLLTGVVCVVLALQQPLLGFLPLALLPLMWVGWRADQVWERARQATAADQQLAHEVFRLATTPAAGKELRVFDLGSELLQRHAAAEQRVVRTLDRASWQSSLVRSASWVLFAAGFVAAVLVVVQRAAEGQATPGDVVLVITLGLAVVGFAGGLGEALPQLSQLSGAGQRLLWLQEQAASTSPAGATAAPPSSLQDGLRLRDVGFTYADRDRSTLADIDLFLPAGKVVAFVGDNGAGKSTLVKLVCGLYRPSEGHITVDGVDLDAIDSEQWRQCICAGFQDFVPFEFRAGQTVGIGDLPREADDEAVEAAITRAGSHDVVRALPDGLRTQLGRSWTNGSELSTGQWQKLALSRALMRDAPLLVVLDEPTAALDPSAEHRLFQRFAGASEAARKRGAVTVLVSHRFSTVRFADIIVVLDEGRIIDTGSHDELMSRDGLYAELFRLQMVNYR